MSLKAFTVKKNKNKSQQKSLYNVINLACICDFFCLLQKPILFLLIKTSHDTYWGYLFQHDNQQTRLIASDSIATGYISHESSVLDFVKIGPFGGSGSFNQI